MGYRKKVPFKSLNLEITKAACRLIFVFVLSSYDFKNIKYYYFNLQKRKLFCMCKMKNLLFLKILK